MQENEKYSPIRYLSCPEIELLAINMFPFFYFAELTERRIFFTTFKKNICGWKYHVSQQEDE